MRWVYHAQPKRKSGLIHALYPILKDCFGVMAGEEVSIDTRYATTSRSMVRTYFYELRQWQKAWLESGYLLTMNEYLASKYGPIPSPDTLRRILDQIREDAARLYGFKR